IRGYVGQTLEEMDTRHFVMEAFEGPTPDGRYTITARDVLKLADDDRAQAPRPSSGYLLADITAGASSAVLGPVGIGNIEYPASGERNLGGKELVRLTRSGDTLTLPRGQFYTAAWAQKAQDRAQFCHDFVGAYAANILRTLFVDYAGIDSGYIDIN